MKITGVIFDMDGLMFDTERIYYQTWQLAAKAFGYEIDWSIYTQLVARNSRYIEKKLKENFGEAFPYTEVATLKKKLSNEIIEKEGLKLQKGLEELLSFLNQENIKKAVATSSNREKTKWYLQLAGLENQFETVVCGCDVIESKPNPEIFLKAAKKLGCEPKECLVLEDSRLGLQAGKRGGMRTVLIPDFVQPDEEMHQNADYVLESLEQVILLIKR